MRYLFKKNYHKTDNFPQKAFIYFKAEVLYYGH